MRPRSKATRGPAKEGRRKAQTPKRRNNSTAGRGGSAPAEEETELARLRRERDKALERETAAAEVLKVISSSPGELESVFKAMLVNAMRICEANFGTLFRFAGKAFEFAAEVGTPPELAEFQKQRGPFQPAGDPLKHIMQTKQVCHLWDSAKSGTGTAPTKLGGARSIVGVPMLKDNALVGAITIYRTEVRPFSEKQIELLQNFGAQAVIAIENTRLLNELRQRTTDLAEALEQQTATAEVLSVISSSPGELGPVFDAVLKNATRICEAKFGTLLGFDGSAFHLAAQFGTAARTCRISKEARTISTNTGHTP